MLKRDEKDAEKISKDANAKFRQLKKRRLSRYF